MSVVLAVLIVGCGPDAEAGYQVLVLNQSSSQLRMTMTGGSLVPATGTETPAGSSEIVVPPSSRGLTPWVDAQSGHIDASHPPVVTLFDATCAKLGAGDVPSSGQLEVTVHPDLSVSFAVAEPQPSPPPEFAAATRMCQE